MKNRRHFIFLAAWLLLTGAPLTSLADSSADGEGERYVIQKGDTLWDLAADKMGNPFRWPELWKANPYIIDPDLIYPGNPLILRGLPPAPAQAPPGPGSGPEEPVAPPLPAALGEPAPEPAPAGPPAAAAPPENRAAAMPPPPLSPTEEEVVGREIPPLLAASGGWIVRGISPAGVVEGSPEEKTLFGQGDRIFIRTEKKKEVAPGDLYTLYRPIRPVIHPKTRRPVGDLIEILGTVKIDMKEGRKAVGTIKDSFDHVTAGDRLLSSRADEIVAAGPAPDRITGILLEALYEKTIIGQHDVIYLDKGAIHGLGPGLRFAVSRGGETVGEIQVLSVQKETSTLLVTRSFVPLEPGDELVLLKR